jgi:hypothetical protein
MLPLQIDWYRAIDFYCKRDERLLKAEVERQQQQAPLYPHR